MLLNARHQNKTHSVSVAGQTGGFYAKIGRKTYELTCNIKWLPKSVLPVYAVLAQLIEVQLGRPGRDSQCNPLALRLNFLRWG